MEITQKQSVRSAIASVQIVFCTNKFRRFKIERSFCLCLQRYGYTRKILMSDASSSFSKPASLARLKKLAASSASSVLILYSREERRIRAVASTLMDKGLCVTLKLPE